MMSRKIKLIVVCILLVFCSLIIFITIQEKRIERITYVNQEITNSIIQVDRALTKNLSLVVNSRKIEKEKFFELLNEKRALYAIKKETSRRQREYEEERERLRQEQLLRDNAKLIFIGDSRTVAMCNAVTGSAFWGTEYLDHIDSNGNIWIAHGGIAYAYLRDTGFPLAESHLEPYDSVIVLMGINDDTPGNSYAELTNQFYEKHKDLNISVYYVSINPVVDSSRAARQYHRTNTLLSEKNQAIQSNLLNEVKYIDTYSEIISTFETYDGIHYTDSVSRQIYDIILDNL